MSARTHRIRHFVYAGDELVPRTRAMHGAWGCEAKCSCGWETSTGGAVRSYVDELVHDHKLDVELDARKGTPAGQS